MMQAIDMPTISHKQLANQQIPLVAEEARVGTAAMLDKALLVDGSSGGWRKYCSEQGSSLLGQQCGPAAGASMFP
jgi:hypothetical protein